MADPLTGRLSDLRKACSLLFDEVERRFGPEIDLQVDHYWEIDLRAAYELADDPAGEIVAGQVSDDLGELHDLTNRPEEEGVILWHDLDHLSGILRALAFQDLPGQG